jgi:predicted CoA-substrate-specific enzyme activase
MKVIYAGIDVGGKNVHIVIMKDGSILAKGSGPAGLNKAKTAEDLYNDLLSKTGLKRLDVKRLVTTGSSGKRVTIANGYIADAAADARGIVKLVPTARTVIDVGGEEGRAVRISPDGKVRDFAVNERCAAGTGTFIEAMARALEVTVDEMARISLLSTKAIPMNAQCAVFGESEVVSLVHQKVSKQDIARSVHDAISGRIGSVARIVGLENDVVMIGGVALNAGFIDSLKRDLKMDVIVPADPDYVGAIGAAVAAEIGITEEKINARVVEKPNIEEGKA